ncbi:hypothetical protein KC332_g15275 [Hortaea werneckii]|uniref:DNA polymerase V n=2 Tax=Hortaea werneckii TaxID=91943 RepID=A0A3M7J6Z0_HORWE|nr:hypothetical protein KC358_g11485 [Hortaea werneckii]OTA39700.1 hypothetical protein BTJ68_00322 [Hortaea werneckii EXF-2000]KAI6816250.1 hypothetical protein KC350_g10834 [Hortaea werneckii]KAI6916061.1 hypothetical protein KC348_g11733 [Hortaea werneckii]KAI6929004.1 hypothetical protein KC341_g11140 [Hortaea werneckii]
MKRERAVEETPDSDGIHPARKRRVQYGEEQAQLVKLYNDLADETSAVRLKAATDLLRVLSEDSPSQGSLVDQAISRLVKGLCSARKAARLGFSIALSEVLRLAFKLGYKKNADGFRLGALTVKVDQLTQTDNKASGQEKREYLLGRRFAYQAILQSDVGLADGVSPAEWQSLLSAIMLLAKQKDWLRSECGAVLYEYLQSGSGKRLSDERIQTLIDMLKDHKLLKSPEGVALWLSVEAQWPKTLPKDVWHKKDPLSGEELLQLRKILQGGGIEEEEGSNGKTSRPGTRQSQPSFVWKVLFDHLHSRKEKTFKRFSDEVITEGFFASSSSTERKAFGLQIVRLAVSSAPGPYLRYILSQTVLRTVINHRGEANRTLFEAAKLPLDQIVQRTKQEPAVADSFFSPMALHGAFDQSTKSKTIESLLQHADVEALQRIVATVNNLVVHPKTESSDQVDSRRRVLADVLLTALRSNREPSRLLGQGQDLAAWARDVFHILTSFGYIAAEPLPSPPLSEASRSIFRSRLMSCLNSVMDQSPSTAVAASTYVLNLLHDRRKEAHKKLSKQAAETLRAARKHAQGMEGAGNAGIAGQAYKLLFNLSMLQVYNEEIDSVEALQDLNNTFDGKQSGGEATMMLVELLLSFVSKPSALFRKLAEQVFAAFAAEMTSDGLQSLIDILEQKEGLSGQQALFQDQNDEDARMEDATSEQQSEENGIDVEDMSDVELVNGEEAGSESDESEDDADDSSSSESDSAGASGEDEEAVFDRKLADALGTAKADEGSDDDESDMDDEQMMALEPHLTNIFKERKKDASKKQEGKDAKENIINFKNRVLDLLNIYVKGQYGQTLALDLILPLTILVRTTTSKPTSERAFAVLKQYFDSCSKHKTLPQPQDQEACSSVLQAVHEEMKKGGSKLHANACSRSSLFLAKVLVALDPKHYPQIAQMYATLQSQWYLDPKSKIHGSVFTEWTSWSLATRKQQGSK